MILTNVAYKMKAYGTLVMFQHTIFSLSFGLVSMTLALKLTTNSFISPWKICLIMISLLSARTGANAINRVIDAEIDAKNPRTALRQIPQGLLSKKEVVLFSIVCFFIMVLASFFINPLCAVLSPFALILLIAYSYTKRVTFFCHLILGITCAIAPMGAWIAVTGNLGAFTPVFWKALDAVQAVFSGDFGQSIVIIQQTGEAILAAFSRENTFFIPLFLAAANACWVAGFDIIYGAQDVEFDRSFGVHSIPAKFGIKNALHISTLLHLLVVLFLFLVGWMVEGFEWLYFMGLLLITVLLIIEHKVVKPTNLAHAKIASYTINEVVSIVFIVFPILDLFL